MENDYQEIDLKELIVVILRKWWLLTILAVLGGVISYYVTVNYIQPIYKAETSLFIGKEESSLGGIGISLSELQTYNSLIEDYKELAQTRMVLEPVINDLELNMTIITFKNSLSINTIGDSRFFSVAFEHTNPQLAADAANKLAEELSNAAAEVVEVENIRIIDKALVPYEPVSPNLKLNIVIAMVLGVMLGLFIIFLGMFLDNTIVNEEDIENEYGLTVLGVIPKFNGEAKI